MTIPTPQEVQRLIDNWPIACRSSGGDTLAMRRAGDALVAALSAYQQEVERLRERVAPLDEGPVCLLADYKAMRDRAEAAEARVRELEQRDNDWLIERGVQGALADASTTTPIPPMGASPDAYRIAILGVVAEARRSAFAEAAQMVASLGAQSEDAYVRDALQNCAVVLAKATPPIHTEEP
jgi:hypothetical protein